MPDCPLVMGSCVRIFRLVILLIAGFASLSFGQTSPCPRAEATKLVCLLGNLTVQTLAPVLPNFTFPPGSPTGTDVLISPLTASLPVPSPASGAVYTLDRETGVYSTSTQSFGPILTERGETIGRRNIAFGFAYQHFDFDKIDGQDVHKISFQVDPRLGVWGYNFNLGLDQYTTFATYGLSERTDVSVAIPFKTIHFAVSLNIPFLPTASASQSATGIGDVTVQIKQNIYKKEDTAIAAGLAIRTPTGDPYDGLGAGAIGIRPFIAGSHAYRFGTPHVNLGYEWNGASVLTGNILTGEKANIPQQLIYAAGFDSPLTRNLTVSFDVIGRELFNARRVQLESVAPPLNNALSDTFYSDSFGITNGSVGVKLKTISNLIVTGNVLFRLDDGGLRSRVVPLIGISYTLH
jgi:Putative MetA-pathway of phenol degradation